MKKSFKLAGIALVLAAAVFTSCAPAASSDDKRIYDDVELSSVAFPGYNYIVYTPVSEVGVYDLITDEVKTEVAGGSATVSANVTKTEVPNVARSYILYRNDGKLLETFTSSSNSSFEFPYYGLDYYFVDKEIVDGEKYEYTLYLDGKKIKSTEVTAIKPEYSINGKLTTASDLVAYDNWSDEVVTADNITVDVNYKNDFIVTFPAKRYLNYNVQLYKGNGLELFGKFASVDPNPLTASSKTETQYYKPDYVAKYAKQVYAAGEYTVKVTVSSTAGYEDDVVVASKKVTIDKLDVATGTGDVNGAYIDEGETIRLVWTPAKKADQSNWSADNYKVYTLDTKGVYTLVSEKVKEAEAEAKEAEETAEEVIKSIGKDTQGVYSDVYYLDYKVVNNKVAYEFVVVLSDNGKFESINKTKTIGAYDAKAKAVYDENNVNAAFTDLDKDGANNDLVLTFSGFTAGDTRKLKSVKYFIAEKPDTTYVLDSELTGAAVVPSADYTTYDVVIKDVPFDSKVVYQYTISDDKKDDLVVTKVTDDVSSIATTIKPTEFALSTEQAKLTDDTTAKVKVTVAPKDKALYTYAVYVAKLDPNSASYESVTTWTPLTVELKAATDKLSWVAEASTTLTPTEPTKDGTTDGKTVSLPDKFVFKYVKTNTKYASVTNKATAVGYSNVVEVTKFEK